jgi:hypothetical protein
MNKALKIILPLAVVVLGTSMYAVQKQQDPIRERLKAAVEAGDLTQEQAKAMYIAYKKTAPRQSGESDVKVKRGQRNAEGQRQQRGERQEQGQRQQRGERQEQGQRQQRGERQEQGQRQQRGERQEQGQRQQRGEGLAKLEQRLNQGVADGKFTRQQADQRLAQAQQRMQQANKGERQQRGERPRGEKGQDRSKLIERKKDSNQKPRGEERMAIFRERLGEAVKSGKMTRAEAGEKMAAAQKRMQQKPDSDKARGERPQGDRGQDRSKLIERKKNAGKKEGKKSTCENCDAQKQRR